MSSGILSVQKMWIESAVFTVSYGAVLCCYKFVVGQHALIAFPAADSHADIFSSVSGKTLPCTNAVANAIANNPQFALPDCIWTSMTLSLMSIVNKIEGICCFTNRMTEWYTLSYNYTHINTSASLAAAINCAWSVNVHGGHIYRIFMSSPHASSYNLSTLFPVQRIPFLAIIRICT